MIVREHIDFVSVQGAAEKIASASHAAYWLHNVEGGSSALKIQEDDIIHSFKAIAHRLGFEVVPVEPALEAAE